MAASRGNKELFLLAQGIQKQQNQSQQQETKQQK